MEEACQRQAEAAGRVCRELCLSCCTFIIPLRQGSKGSSCALAPRRVGLTRSDDGRTGGELLRRG